MPNPLQMQAMMGQLSDAQLAQIAQSPQMAGEQLVAVQELDRRKQMRSQSVSKPPQSTVLQDRVAESMPVQQSTMHGDPIMAGLAAIQQQHGGRPMQAPPAGPNGYACGGLVRKYANGGLVDQYVGDLNTVMPAIQSAMGGPQSPDDWLKLAAQFQGPDQLAPFEKQLAGRQGRLDADRHRNVWLALANAGFDMASTGDVGHGGLAGVAALQNAENQYNQGEDSLLERQMGLASARQSRDDASRNAAFSGYTGRQDTAFRAGLGAAGDIGRLRESQADRAAANWRDTNDIDTLARAIYQGNQGRLVPHGTNAQGNPIIEPYSMTDAYREASEAYTQRYTGRQTNYAASAGAAARAILADPRSSADLRAQAQATLARIQSLISGGMSPEEADSSVSSATGTQTAGERTNVPSQGSGSVSEFQRSHPVPQPNTVYEMDSHGNVRM